MSIEKTIVLKVDSKQAVKSFDKLGDTINEQKQITIEFEEELIRLQRQLSRTSKSNLPAQKRIKGQIVGIKDALKDQRVSLKRLNLEQKQSRGATKDLAKAFGGQRNTLTNLSAVTGGYANQLFSVFDLFRSGIKQIKAFVIAQRAAFIATGIGIFLIALAAIAANWDKIIEFIKGANKELQKQIDQSIELQKSTKLLIDLKESEIKLAEKQGRATVELQKQLIALIRLQSELNDEELEGLETQALRLKTSALELTTREKILRAVLNAASAGTGDAFILKRQLEDLKLFKEIQDLITQARKEQIDLAIQLFDIENPDIKREDVVSSGIGEQLQRDRNIADKSLELQLEFLNKSLEIVQQNEDDKFKIQTDGLVKVAAARAKDRQDQINLDNALANEEQEREQALADFKVNIGKSTLGLLGAIAREGSAVAKGVQVAQATIAGIESVINTFKTASASPITTFLPVYPFIQAGIAGAFSAVQIQKIISTDPSGGGGVASLTGGGASAPSAPSFNLVAGSGTNQIAESLAGDPVPIQAFVVSSAVTSAQSLDRNIENEASFG